jgi:hypothetical protein
VISLLSTLQALPDAERADLERALVPVARRAAVGALAADIAHDAGNALFGLTGLIGLIREGEPVGAPGRTALTTAAADLDLALRPLLRFAQPVDDEGARADLAVASREALELYRHGDRKLLVLEEEVPDTPVRVACAPSAALQAVVHLLLSADPAERLEVAPGSVTVAPAREASLDEVVAARIAADAGGTLGREGGSLVLRLPSA